MMQLRSIDSEKQKRPLGRASFQLSLSLVLCFLLFNAVPGRAQEDIGAELDRAEGLSGGTPSRPAPPASADAPSAEVQPPASQVPIDSQTAPSESQTQETNAIPVTPPANEPTPEAAPSDKEKTLEAKGLGDEVPAQKVCNCKFEASVPYRDRKPAISGFFGLEVGSYSPVNYAPDFVATTFSNYYSQATLPPGLNFGAKYNSPVGAIGVQIGGTFFNTKNVKDGASLTVIPATIGIIAELNTLFSEPYVVPYGIFGEYTGIYDEKAGAFEVKGNSPFSQFYAIGLMFQLDWMDTETHADAYEGFGLENTFLYVEGRSYLPSSTGIPNLSTPLQVAGGLKLEF